MKILLTTAALAALMPGSLALAQQDDGARAVSPDEYFGTRAREATSAAPSEEERPAPVYEAGEPADPGEASPAREAERGEDRDRARPQAAQTDRGDLAERLRQRDEARRGGTGDRNPATVEVRVSGVAEGGGQVFLALQTKDGFASGGGEYTKVVEAGRGGTVTATFEDVTPGEYALAVFQDTDGDGTVTLGKAGPTEPWALSGKAEGAPRFEASAFEVSGETRAAVTLTGGDEAKRAETASGGGGATVTVRVRGIKQGEGDLFVALQDEKGFAKAEGAYAQMVTPDGRSVEVVFEDVAPGAYAASAFQDTDGDGGVTLSETGPTEPWGVSGRRSRGAPEFDRAKFDVDDDGATAAVRLRAGSPPAARPEPADEAAKADAPARAATAAPEMRSEPKTEPSASTALVYRQAATLAPSALTASDFLGADFVNADGDELAEIADVIVDADGRATGVVLASGGLFGLGADYYAVTFNRVRVERDDDDLVFRSVLTEADVEQLTEFPYDRFKEDSGGRFLASQLRGAQVPLGATGEDAEVEDVVMTSEGGVEALVLSFDGETLVAPFSQVRRSESGDVYIDVGEAGAAAFARYEGRADAPRRRGLFNR